MCRHINRRHALFEDIHRLRQKEMPSTVAELPGCLSKEFNMLLCGATSKYDKLMEKCVVVVVRKFITQADDDIIVVKSLLFISIIHAYICIFFIYVRMYYLYIIYMFIYIYVFFLLCIYECSA